jgi:3-mercaptopyruvate sulfurtransferase SseA
MSNQDKTISCGFRDDLPRWQHLVAPEWLAGLIAGKRITASPAGDWRLLEIGFNVLDAYLHGHIPGASYIDTAEFEQGVLWNKVDDAVLLDLLLRHGIRHDTTVVVYARNPLAAARAAHLMLYAGVSDVRMLDGGHAGWTARQLPLAQGLPAVLPAAENFGSAFPAHPEYLVDMREVRQLPAQPDACLVSIRTWNEFVGRTSGYSYIPARGEIADALWGRSGSDDDVNSMSEFHDACGRMQAAAAISLMWAAEGIRPEKRTVFYCGTGWRASLAFFYAWLMKWERISVYDGGWCEWSRDPRNSVVCRVNAAYERFRQTLEDEPAALLASYNPASQQDGG